MNKKQRYIINKCYNDFLKNCMRGDPVSNSNLLGELIYDLGKEDKKLESELKETLDEVPE